MAAARIVGIALLSLCAGSAIAQDWRGLSGAQKRALAPLASEWSSLDADSRARWLNMVERFDRLTPEEQARVQRRMSDWASLSPGERARAVEQYRALRRKPPEEREALQQRWQEYQQLSPEERASARKANKKKSKKDKD